MDLQYEVRGAGVAVSIGDGVGERFRAIAAAMQGFEIGVAGVQCVGVSAVGVQHQCAERPRESTRRHGTGRYTVGALHVIGQDVTGERQQSFRRGAVAVIDGSGHVVGDVDVQRTGRRVAVSVAGDHGELFAEIVAAVARRVGLVAVEGVAVTDYTRRRVVAGDGQGVAELRGDRLRKTDSHATADDVDATDAQVTQTIRRRDGEAAALGQRARIGC